MNPSRITWSHMNSRMKVNEAHKLKKYTLLVINHRGGSILLWKCFAAFGLEILKIKGIKDKEQHLAFLKNNINVHERCLCGITSHSTMKLTRNIRYKLLQDIYLTQSLDLIPIEKLWVGLKKI